MNFPRYPHYKDSGVEWLGTVPDHWHVIPLKHLADFVNGDAFKPTEWADAGIPIIRIQNLNGSEEFNYFDGEVEERYKVHDGDLLFGWSGNRGTSFGPFRWKRQEVCALNQHIFRVVPYDMNVDSAYWMLKAVTAHVEDQAHGIIGMVHVTKGDLGAICVPQPPPAEQMRIAAFLNSETAKIDGLVAEQQRLIELLKEKRQATISHAVTKGLNPAAPMKPSGIEWLGDVPAHWTVTRLTNLLAEVVDTGSEGLPILSVSIHHGVSDDELGEEYMERQITRSEDRSKYKRVKPGDLVYNMMRAWQGGFGSVTVDGMVSPAYVVARPRQTIVTPFIEHLLRTPQAIEQMRRHSRGVTDFRLRLYWSEFKDITVPLPSLSEAREICTRINALDTEFSRMTLACEDSIQLLQERRTALISAAVTGQIDVRGLAEPAAA